MTASKDAADSAIDDTIAPLADRRPAPLATDPAVLAPPVPTMSPAQGRKLRLVLAVDHLFGSTGLFSLFPVLGLLLADRTPGSGTTVVGVGLFCYTASAGLSALLVNRWLAAVRYRAGMAVSTLV